MMVSFSHKNGETMPRTGMELPDWVEAMTKPPSLAATGFQEISPVLALSRAKGDA
jgi:hypothetical protein